VVVVVWLLCQGLINVPEDPSDPCAVTWMRFEKHYIFCYKGADRGYVSVHVNSFISQWNDSSLTV